MLDNPPMKIKEPGVLYIKPISSFLRRLRLIEQRKPQESQRPVPTLQDLSDVVGIGVSGISGMSRNKTLKLSVANQILDEMNRRGFLMEVTDLLGYEPPVFVEPEPPSEPPKPQGIEALVAEYAAADEEHREAMRKTMPHIVKAIERHLVDNE